jgi:DNA-binding beta-propeller fold protein YncE
MARARYIQTLMLVSFALVGCAKPAGAIFEPLPQPMLWPKPPDPPRVAYVGQLATSADLKPEVSFGEAVGAAIFGRTPDRSMLTPYALCTDGGDRLFVADTNAQVIHVFDLKTRRYDQWKPPPKGATPFTQPVGVAWDSGVGRLFVADSVGGRVYVFDTRGKLLAEIGQQHLNRPCGIAFDHSGQRLIVADVGLHQLVVLRPDGSLVERVGTRGVGPGEFNFPTNLAIDSQRRVYVSDSLNFRVQQFGPDLKHLRTIGKKGDLPGYFGQPKGVALDVHDHLYVVDAHFEAVQVFDSADGALLMDFGQEGSGRGEFWLPTGIFVDSRNRIWIADSYNRRVQVFDYLPEVQP